MTPGGLIAAAVIASPRSTNRQLAGADPSRVDPGVRSNLVLIRRGLQAVNGGSPNRMPRSQSAAHARDKALDVVDRRLRQNAVAEIEDVRAPGEAGKDVLNRLVERPAAGDQRQWIEVALEGEPRRQQARGDVRVDGRVKADCRETRDVGDFRQMRRRAAGEGDDRRRRPLAAQAGDEPFDRLDAPALEFLRRQDTRPGIRKSAPRQRPPRSGAPDSLPRRRRGG